MLIRTLAAITDYRWQACCLERPFLLMHLYVNDPDMTAGFSVVQVIFKTSLTMQFGSLFLWISNKQ